MLFLCQCEYLCYFLNSVLLSILAVWWFYVFAKIQRFAEQKTSQFNVCLKKKRIRGFGGKEFIVKKMGNKKKISLISNWGSIRRLFYLTIASFWTTEMRWSSAFAKCRRTNQTNTKPICELVWYEIIQARWGRIYISVLNEIKQKKSPNKWHCTKNIALAWKKKS